MQWKTKEELDREREEGTLDNELHYVTLEDHILAVPHAYLQAVSNARAACCDVSCCRMLCCFVDASTALESLAYCFYTLFQSMST